MRLGETRVQGDGVAEGGDGRGGVAVAVPTEAQLVQDARCFRVEAQVVEESGFGVRVLAEPGVDVAELFERTSGRGVEPGGRTQVAQRGGQFTAPAVGLAALQVGQHRVRFPRHGTAERFDGQEGVSGGDGRVAVGDEAPILAIVTDGGVREDARDTGCQQDAGHDHTVHAAMVARTGTFSGSAGLTVQGRTNAPGNRVDSRREW